MANVTRISAAPYIVISAQVAAGKLSLNKAAKMAGVSKGYTKGSKADPVTEEGEKLVARCAEHLEAIHAEFPGFTVLEIAKGCITAAKHFIDGKYSPAEWATAAKITPKKAKAARIAFWRSSRGR